MDFETKKIIDFLLEIEKLKLVKRVIPLSDKVEKESTPEHVWHMCMYAILLEKKFDLKIDLLKTLKMILVHDLVEVYAGDTNFWDHKAREDKQGREEEAAKKLFNKLPDDFKKEFTNLWHEFEECKNNEAKIAKSIDRLQAVGQHISSKGIGWREMNVTPKMMEEKVYPLIEDDFLKNMWKEFFELAKKEKMLADSE